MNQTDQRVQQKNMFISHATYDQVAKPYHEIFKICGHSGWHVVYSEIIYD